MSDSLKDQLIALGLAKAKAKANPPAAGKKRKPRRDAARPARPKPGTGEGDISLDEAFRRRAREERREAERVRQAKLAEDQRRREINQALQALVDEHARNDPEAELKRNFMYKGRIRSVPVNAAQLQDINRGELALVFLRGRYFLVSAAVARQAAELSPEHVPDLSGPDAGAADDGDHPVPDDLLW